MATRVTQVAVEALVASSAAKARVTQAVVEVLVKEIIARPKNQTVII